MYAWETGPVEDMALLLLCGDAEFKVRHLGCYPFIIGADPAAADVRLRVH